MTKPLRYMLRPVIVTAMQWNPEDPAAVAAMVDWLAAHGVKFEHPPGVTATATLTIVGDGQHIAHAGDWVLRSDDGRTFVLHADAFAVACHRKFARCQCSHRSTCGDGAAVVGVLCPNVAAVDRGDGAQVCPPCGRHPSEWVIWR